jgi:hypothetical protein
VGSTRPLLIFIAFLCGPISQMLAELSVIQEGELRMRRRKKKRKEKKMKTYQKYKEKCEELYEEKEVYSGCDV